MSRHCVPVLLWELSLSKGELNATYKNTSFTLNNLSVGEWVHGSCLSCPSHSWRWSRDWLTSLGAGWPPSWRPHLLARSRCRCWCSSCRRWAGWVKGSSCLSLALRCAGRRGPPSPVRPDPLCCRCSPWPGTGQWWWRRQAGRPVWGDAEIYVVYSQDLRGTRRKRRTRRTRTMEWLTKRSRWWRARGHCFGPHQMQQRPKMWQ